MLRCSLFSTVGSLIHVAHGRVVRYSLKEASPRLSTMLDTSIPMPGVGGSMEGGSGAGSAAVTISGFVDELTVLPTKTRPKKRGIKGCHGRTYTDVRKVACCLAAIVPLPVRCSRWSCKVSAATEELSLRTSMSPAMHCVSTCLCSSLCYERLKLHLAVLHIEVSANAAPRTASPCRRARTTCAWTSG